MLKQRHFVLIIIAIMFTITSTSHAALKCWTNREGTKECGDSVPPEYSQKSHQEISETGIVIKEVEGAISLEEFEQNKQKRKEEQEIAKQAKIQKAQDDILLQTYTSVEEIEINRDGKLQALDIDIKLIQTRNKTLQTRYDKHLGSAKAKRQSGEEISEAELQNIKSIKKQIVDNKASLEKRIAKREKLMSDYANYIERFQYLLANKKNKSVN